MKVAIIKYNAGNIQSVYYALQRLGIESEVTNDIEKIINADKVIFPGVGEASTTMNYLRKHHLDDLIRTLCQPVLGICLGMQLMCRHSEEGDVDCIGIFDEEVKRFVTDPLEQSHVKIPHMGWNDLYNVASPLFNSNMEKQYVYFVHSYYATLGENAVATCNYIVPFAAAMNKNNFYATQFHPEKSGPLGAMILKNFIETC